MQEVGWLVLVSVTSGESCGLAPMYHIPCILGTGSRQGQCWEGETVHRRPNRTHGTGLGRGERGMSLLP